MPKNALIAVELADAPARWVLDRATALLEPDDHCYVVHVVAPLNLPYIVDPGLSGAVAPEYIEQTLHQARTLLSGICGDYGIAVADQHVLFGRICEEIHAFVRTNRCDCIMLGSHGILGWRPVLGTQAASILNGAPVDVWVFQLPKLRTET